VKTVAIVQARTGSTRLPGKVLEQVGGRPMLAQLLRRLREARALTEIMVATTTESRDDAVVELAGTEGIGCFRGSEDDVLSRYVGAARNSGAEIVVRLTADCPLIDAGVVDRVVATLIDGAAEYDYVSNVVRRTYPQGLDVEALFVDTLERVYRLARSPEAREHVTWFVASERPELFLVGSVTDDEDNSDLRWTVDTPADLELVRRLYDELDLGTTPLGYRAILAQVRSHPQLTGFGRATAPDRDAG
jgi:spore coat polysaccharide biosynthesis protein SpsF